MSKEQQSKRVPRRDFIKMMIGVADGVLLPPNSEPITNIHSVNFGETPFSYCSKYGLKLDYVIQAGPQVGNVDLIKIGQEVFIPKATLTQRKKETR